MPDPITPDRLAEIRARVEAATPGPWTVECERDFSLDDDNEAPRDIWRGIMGPNGSLNTGDDCELFSEADADFIAHAREDVPILLDEVERLQARVAALEEALRVSHEFLVKFERAGDRIICSAEGGECPAWWNEHFDALHGEVECWTASAQLHAAIDAARKEAGQ